MLQFLARITKMDGKLLAVSKKKRTEKEKVKKQVTRTFDVPPGSASVIRNPTIRVRLAYGIAGSFACLCL